MLSSPHFESSPRPALVLGLGERLERVACPGATLALIIPPMGCPTGPVYKQFDALPPRPLREADVRGLIERSNRVGTIDPAGPFNDLEWPAFAVAPGLREVRDRTAAALGLPVHVTGSGSTLFAVLGRGSVDPADALSACARVRAAAPEAAVLVARLIG